MTLSRRGLLGAATAAGALLAAPRVIGQARPRVVVVGGGVGGTTAARYLAKDAQGALDVVLVEPTRKYYTCFFSNLYIGGFWDYEKLGHDYGTLASDYGVNVIHDRATGIDRDAREVALAGGGRLSYDRLALSPGIDFVEGSVPGWDVTAQHAMPHAYKAGHQTQLLKAQVERMPEGGTFVMVAPPNPYRCPPGPYERVSMIAHLLTEQNPSAKILVFDPKDKFSKMGLFQEAWATRYPGMIEWVGGVFGEVEEVRPEAMEVIVGETVKADVCNVIPAQKAGLIAETAGLTNDAGWVEIVPATMQSRADENIHVLGDATDAGDMPKSGYSANSQAKAAAMAIRAALTDSRAFPPKYSNTCWSLLGTDDGVKVGASYEATEDRIAKTDGFISETGESVETRRQTYQESLGWYAGITADMFG